MMEAQIVGGLRHQGVERGIAGEAEDVVGVVVLRPVHGLDAAVVTVTAPDDPGLRPMSPQALRHVLDDGPYLRALRGARRAQDRHYRRATRHVIDVHRCKAALVVMRVGPHRPILVVYSQERVFAFDNRCPHMGFPLDRGSVEDGILTCHWHHARFDLASGCTFDLWADDVPTCPVEVRDLEVWVKPTFGYGDPAHWRRRLHDGLAHNLGNAPRRDTSGWKPHAG